MRAVFPGRLSNYHHLHYLVGLEDNSEETTGVALGVRLAFRRLLRLRSLESFSLGLTGLRGSRSYIHLCQHQLFFLDRVHRCLPLRVHREVEQNGRRQFGAVFPSY